MKDSLSSFHLFLTALNYLGENLIKLRNFHGFPAKIKTMTKSSLKATITFYYHGLTLLCIKILIPQVSVNQTAIQKQNHFIHYSKTFLAIPLPPSQPPKPYLNKHN